jgi:outer membrane protein assembly factor BamB
VITEFRLANPDDNRNWKIKLDLDKKILSIASVDGKYHWAKKITKSMPIDAFLVKKNVFLIWERPDDGYDRLQDFSMVYAQDLFTGKVLWEWKDNIISILPFEQFIFIITYRNQNQKGYFIKTEAREGKVIWKVASDAPLISWDINETRVILKDFQGRVYALNTRNGKLHRERKKK